MEFIYNMAIVQNNHCIIMETAERFGGKVQNIKIRGKFAEWLLYFAKYK